MTDVIVGKRYDKDGNLIGPATASLESTNNVAAAKRDSIRYRARRAQRKAALEAKWKTPWDFFDDMAERGHDVVLAERKQIIDSLPSLPNPGVHSDE